MIRYIKYKVNKIKFQSMLYEAIASIVENQGEIIELIWKMYAALKDVPAEELRKEIVEKLAEIVHETNKINS
ncbi:MAG: hypothetical protein J1D87_04140 [Lachnospiraceae bacterium]|nr:hypothetical protein [Lachnospiraceae bacterium]